MRVFDDCDDRIVIFGGIHLTILNQIIKCYSKSFITPLKIFNRFVVSVLVLNLK